jgi:hypothetical protein
MATSNSLKQGLDLQEYQFRTEAPKWVDLPSESEYHVGVVHSWNDKDKDTYYKALIQLNDEQGGEQRWRVWNEKEGQMPYGPDLPPAVIKMLVAYMSEQD